MELKGKRTRDQDEFDFSEQDQKAMRMSPDNFQQTESSTGRCLIESNENELRMQGEILIEIEPEITDEFATVQMNPEWCMYTTRRKVNPYWALQ